METEARRYGLFGGPKGRLLLRDRTLAFVRKGNVDVVLPVTNISSVEMDMPVPRLNSIWAWLFLFPGPYLIVWLVRAVSLSLGYRPWLRVETRQGDRYDFAIRDKAERARWLDLLKGEIQVRQGSQQETSIAIAQAPAGLPQATRPQGNQDAPAVRLAQLKELYLRGIISLDEYDDRRKSILEEI